MMKKLGKFKADVFILLLIVIFDKLDKIDNW